MMRFRHLASLVTVLVLVFLPLFNNPAPAEAALPPTGFDNLAQRAGVIALGTVLSCSSEWNAEHTRIYTDVTFHVEEKLKGSFSQDPVTVTVEGGKADGITEWVEGEPVFTPGERTIVFLETLALSRYRVYGGTQGKFTVIDGQVDGIPLNDFKTKVTRAVKRLPPLSTGDVWQPAGPLYFNGTLPSTPPPQTRAPETRAGWTTVMIEAFENDFPSPGWTWYGNPTWGKTTYNVYDGLYSAYCARDGTAGVNPATGTYPNNMNSWIVYGPVDLSDATTAKLSFAKWVKTATGDTGDNFWILASPTNQSGSWWGYYWTGGSGTWSTSTFDLRGWPNHGNLCGRSQVWIAFAFQSNASATDTGAFVDNIQLQKYTGSVPQIASVTPEQASAGTNSQVVIAGAGFGTTPGAVGFFYRYDKPPIDGSIISWSETSIVTTVPTGIIDGYNASASSGPVYVRNADGVNSLAKPFSVPFSYGGHKWAGNNPLASFYINPNSPDCEGEELAVQRAAATWSGVPDKSFSFAYAGTTSALAAGQNGLNEIVWVNAGSTNYLAHALIWWDESGNILETDIEFSDYYNWSTTDNPNTGQYDVETIALHEMGHWLYLRDLYGNYTNFPQDVDKVMYGFGTTGQVKRTLHADDVTGIRWIYPRTIPTVITNAASEVTANSAQLNGNLESLGSNDGVQVSFEWGETQQYGHTTDIQTLTEPGDFSFTVTNLTPNREYHFRARAQVEGSSDFVYGDDVEFTTKKQFTLTVAVTGGGTTDPSAGEHSCYEGQIVPLTATPADGWRFVNWSGDASGTSTTTTVTMNGNKTVTANFIESGVTLIQSIQENPAQYEGKVFKISGNYLGWSAGYGPPPVSRSDWLLRDITGVIYVTGNSLNLKYPGNADTPVKITGTVRLINGQPYIELPKKTGW